MKEGKEVKERLVELESGGIDLVHVDGLYMMIQFNATCSDAMPYCKGMCCRMRGVYNAQLEQDEILKYKSKPHPLNPQFHILEHKKETMACVYQNEETRACEIHDDKPKVCRAWHCSPGGRNSDGTIPKERDRGWILMPALIAGPVT